MMTDKARAGRSGDMLGVLVFLFFRRGFTSRYYPPPTCWQFNSGRLLAPVSADKKSWIDFCQSLEAHEHTQAHALDWFCV